MRMTSLAQLQEAAAAAAAPEPPRAPVAPQWKPRAIRRYFTVEALKDGRPSGVPVRAESLDEARALAARRALTEGVGTCELLPWETAPADIRDGVLLRHVAFDECSGGEIIRDPFLLRGLYPNEAWRAACGR